MSDRNEVHTQPGVTGTSSAGVLPRAMRVSLHESLPGCSNEGTLALPPPATASSLLATIKTESPDCGDVTNNDAHLDSLACLHIGSTTWARDSHDLFDYEARHVHKKSYFLKKSSRVFRTMLEVQVIPDGHTLPSQPSDYLLSVRQRDGRFLVSPPEKNLQTHSTVMPKRVWLIVKELPRGHHQLQEADVIKLGRFKLRVKQLVKSGPSSLELRLDDVETPHSTVTPEEAVTMQCRICLLDGGTEKDPLVCPCQCKGSIKFVHLVCLRHWINGRLSLTGENQPKSFFFKQLQCELCKTPFPSSVILNDERVSIVNIPKIEAPFIVLENMGGMNRGLHVVSMEERKELKLGRGHESDMRIADVSISRYHATIRFIDGEFILEDHNSKFGTLVALRKVQPVELTHPLAMQVGRTVLSFSLRRPPCNFDEVLGVSDDPMLSTPDTDQEDDSLPDPPPPAQSPGDASGSAPSWTTQQPTQEYHRHNTCSKEQSVDILEETEKTLHNVALKPRFSAARNAFGFPSEHNDALFNPATSEPNVPIALRNTAVMRAVILPVAQSQTNCSETAGGQNLVHTTTRICRPRVAHSCTVPTPSLSTLKVGALCSGSEQRSSGDNTREVIRAATPTKALESASSLSGTLSFSLFSETSPKTLRKTSQPDISFLDNSSKSKLSLMRSREEAAATGQALYSAPEHSTGNVCSDSLSPATSVHDKSVPLYSRNTTARLNFHCLLPC